MKMQQISETSKQIIFSGVGRLRRGNAHTGTHLGVQIRPEPERGVRAGCAGGVQEEQGTDTRPGEQPLEATAEQPDTSFKLIFLFV